MSTVPAGRAAPPAYQVRHPRVVGRDEGQLGQGLAGLGVGTPGGGPVQQRGHPALGVPPSGDAPGRVFVAALAWIGAYGSLVFAGTVGLLATEPGQPADRLLFLVVSAASNVGLSQNPVSTTGNGLFILSAVMLLGRVLPLAALWWAVAVARDEDEIPVG